MDKNKIIIIALIVLIIALLIGLVAIMSNSDKQDTNLTFKSDSTITEGDSLKIMLTDDNGTAIANQTVKITFADKDNTNSDYSVVTNDNGIGELKLDKSAGEYNITISYDGNDNYNGCNATKKITIKEKVVEATVEQNTGSSNTHVVIGEDGYYALLDDNGNFLENLGPSKKYYPNDPNAVYYPNAGHWYVDKSQG